MTTTAPGYEVREFSVKETAAEVRKALRAEFPGVKFSVRMATGTAYGWMRCAWTDGPTSDQVRPVLARFESSRFDGFDDAYHAVEPTLYAREDGTLYEPCYSCCGINWQRDYSPEAEAWAAEVAGPDTIWWARVEHWGHPEFDAPRRLLGDTDLTDGIPAEVPEG